MWGDKRSISPYALTHLPKLTPRYRGFLLSRHFIKSTSLRYLSVICDMHHNPSFKHCFINNSSNCLPLTVRDTSIVVSSHASNYLYASCILYSIISKLLDATTNYTLLLASMTCTAIRETNYPPSPTTSKWIIDSRLILRPFRPSNTRLRYVDFPHFLTIFFYFYDSVGRLYSMGW